MSDPTCGECGQPVTASNAYELDGRIHCGKCAEAALQRAKSSGQPIRVSRYVDKSICSRCHTYIGQGSAVLESGPLRFCASCAALVEDWPYPQWLKLSLVALLILLAFSLLHGRKYFQAGKNLYLGEQLVEKGQYNKALPYLRETLKIAPNSDKGALLTAKAALLAGDPATAQNALQGHNEGRFEKGDAPEFREVNDLWNRAVRAGKELQQADELEQQDGKEAEAASLVHQAAATYPQLQNIALLVDMYDGGVAFAKKDYDGFLTLAEKDWNLTKVATTAAVLASALACKFAVTGDATYRQRSEEMLARAKDLAKNDPEALKQFAEFEQRTRYRLETRDILSKAQYDRKFRNPLNTAK
jgi:hypothetical protein